MSNIHCMSKYHQFQSHKSAGLTENRIYWGVQLVYWFHELFNTRMRLEMACNGKKYALIVFDHQTGLNFNSISKLIVSNSKLMLISKLALNLLGKLPKNWAWGLRLWVPVVIVSFWRRHGEEEYCNLNNVSNHAFSKPKILVFSIRIWASSLKCIFNIPYPTSHIVKILA